VNRKCSKTVAKDMKTVSSHTVAADLCSLLRNSEN
jgi:hypothetical protein